MARDFRAKQVRTSVIIGSGSIESAKPHLGLAFYSASKASDFNGTRNTGGSSASDATRLNLAGANAAAIGTDVWCLFDGQSAGNAAMGNQRANGSAVLFLGDVVVSGSLFAERTMIEVDTTSAGDFKTPNASNAYFDNGFANGGVDILAGAPGGIKSAGYVWSPLFKNTGADLNIQTVTSGDVVITSAGGDVKLSDGSNSIFNFNVAEPTFTIHDDADTGDLFSITVAQHGATTIATIDDDAAAAHLTLDIDGDIILDADGGDISFKDGGTQFLKFTSANSAADVEVYNGAADGDVIFKDTGGNEVFRMDGGEESLKMASGKKIQFADTGEFIYGDGTDIHFGVGGGGNINVPVNIGVTFGHANNQKIVGDGTDISVLSGGSIKLDSGTGAVLGRARGIHFGNNAMNGVAGVAGVDAKIRVFVATGSLNRSTNASDPFDQTAAGTTSGIESGALVISNRRILTAAGDGNGIIKFDGAVNIGTQTVENLTVTGDLEVQGTYTTFNVSTMSVVDPIITLGGGDDNVAPQADDNKDRGVEFLWSGDSSNVSAGSFVTGKSYVITVVGNTTNVNWNAAGASGSPPVVGQEFVATANGVGGTGVAKEFRRGFFGYDDSQSVFTFIPNATVSSDAFSGDLGTARFGKVEYGDSGTYIHQSADSVLALVSDNEVHITATKVGIGTSSPDTIFHIKSAGTNPTVKIESTAVDEVAVLRFDNNRTTDGDIASLIQFYNEGASPLAGIRCFRGSSDTVGDLTLRTSDAERLRIDQDGNVGIGVTDPDTKLEVLSTSMQQKWSYDANSFSSMTVADASHTVIATGETGNFTLDSAGDIELNADGGDITFKDGAQASFKIDMATVAGDAIFKDSAGTPAEIFRITPNILRMASGKQLQFADTGEHISGDGTNLTIASGGDIILTPAGTEVTVSNAAAQLNFNTSDHRIYLNSNTLMFRDGVQTTAKSLSDLASVAPADGVLLSAAGPNRAKSLGGVAITSRDKYVNETNIFADSTPNPSDLFFYVGDDAGSRLNSAFKNNVAVSGSISVVDTTDSLSSTKLTQTSDNLILSMNQSVAATPGAFHNILTIEPAIGVKLGTTAGSGNAGLYFQGTTLNLQKITTTVEGSSQSCIQSQGHILPQADNTFNLGTAARRFANLYTGDLHLCNEGGSNDVDGTSGNWTVQEGEDSLFVINNKTGKKFKMMLQSVEDEE